MSTTVGAFSVPNRILPGAYINFVSAARADAALSERGITAMAVCTPIGPDNEIIRLTATEFFQNSQDIFGIAPGHDMFTPVREAFLNAREILLYRTFNPPGEEDYENFLSLLESQAFHTVACAEESEAIKRMFVNFTRRMREDAGVKIQCVLHDFTEADYEGVISVHNSAQLVPWVAGAAAAASSGRSLINTVYNGQMTVTADFSIRELEDLVKAGAFVFHRVGTTYRVLEDINTLTTLSLERNRDFQDNQTIRLIDQIATDIAAMFNERYLGRTPNDAAGRIALWSDIVAHHRLLEQISAIEDFSPEDVTVEQGATKKSVVVNDVVTPVGAMAQLFMTVVIA